MSLISKFRDTAQGIGYWNAVLFAASRAVEAVFGDKVRIVKYLITVQPVARTEVNPGTGTFEIAFTDDAACPLFAEIARPAETIRTRFAQGARCLMAVSKGKFAGFLWFVVGPYEEDDVRVRFVPAPSGRAAWDFDVMVMPDFRMGRLFSHLWRRASAELCAMGVEHTLSRISAFNASSIAAHRRLGARVVGSTLFFCIGRWQLMQTSFSPRWHLSWRTEQRPVVTVAAN